MFNGCDWGSIRYAEHNDIKSRNHKLSYFTSNKIDDNLYFKITF